MTTPIAPHGGRLVDLFVAPSERAELKAAAAALPAWDLTARQLCDLELLQNGAFSPLGGFLGRADHEAVCRDMRLADGTLWPIPVTLDVSEAFAATLEGHTRIALRDPEGVILAVLDISDRWTPDREAEAAQVFGTTDRKHPGVAHLLERSHPVYVGGRVQAIEAPRHYDFGHLRATPAELRAQFAKLGWSRVVAFQTRNPMHRAHLELTFRAAQIAEANLLIHPVVGLTKPGDIDHYTRVRCYEKLLRHYPERTTSLALLHLAMRMGGPREALWHAIIRKNHGCTHFIVGRDHAGPGNGSDGKPFYGPYDAQTLVAKHEAELGIAMVPFQEMVYVQERAQYLPADEVPAGLNVLNLSGTELRRRLQEGLDIPEWFTYPEVIEELRRTHPPRHRQGFTVFFTGLSGSGKSTIANALLVRLLELGTRPVTLLDGDIVRKHLSSELGFSKEHRDLNVQRIGFVAAEITRNGGIAICAPIAPYAGSRKIVREMVGEGGVFVEVHVSTPLEVCEGRDRKGLYALARAGKIKEFTGISDPYEVPEAPDLRIDTSDIAPDQAVQQIVLKLEALGLIRPTR
ncbi:MAG: bifunctional sulfate adenylyltransferase/adenylylsulfate kinase [Xanthomonadales bacterium]|nr:bifunctional sulfate adenylyltransferase/adenylylsulfate kinase [Xanthomonadales bacterium]